MNIFDEIDSLVLKVKANPDLWNDDVTERNKPTYTGFRGILTSLDDTEEVAQKEYPLLVFDSEETLVMDTNSNEYAPNGALISVHAYTMHVSGRDTNAKKKEAYRLLKLVFDTVQEEVYESVGHISSYFGNIKVLGAVALIEV